LNDKVDFNVDCAFICSPTDMHVQHAIEYIYKSIPVFIEKPLTCEYTDIIRIEKAIRSNPVPSMVGCNLRFHPQIVKAKQLIERKGLPVFVRAETGYYLPYWKPGTDYTKSYSANQNGGVILDAIHEPDYLVWLFNEIRYIKTVCDKVSDLDICKEDVAEIGIIFENGVSASVHCDYLMEKYHRRLNIYYPRKEYHFRINPTNRMYLNEARYFLDCVKNNKEPMNNILEAVYVLKKVLSGGGYNSSAAYFNKVS
jgi:predicted dehydrogenase